MFCSRSASFAFESIVVRLCMIFSQKHLYLKPKCLLPFKVKPAVHDPQSFCGVVMTIKKRDNLLISMA